MHKGVLLFTLVLCVCAPMVQAQIVESGYMSVDLSQYTPPENGEPFIPRCNILTNPGFETGSLPPWTTDNWTVTNLDFYTGSFCAEDYQNHWIRQDFAPIPVSTILSVSMWSRQPSGPAFQAVDFFYGPVDFDEFLVAPGDGWTFINMTGHLRPSGNLQSIRIWGYSGQAPELTRADDVTIEVGGTPTQETTWGWVKFQYRP